LYTSTEGIVWGEGPKDATIFAVGEAPGEDEGVSLKPFQGGSGRVLNAQFIHAGIERKKIFLTNVVKCRPTARGANGKIVNRTPTETEIRCCAPFLLKELNTVKPNVILTLGNIAHQTITGTKKGILQVRSVPTEGPKRRGPEGTGPERYKVVGTFHPAGIMRQQHLWPAAVFDLARAKAESAYEDIRRRPWKYTIHAQLDQVGEYLERRIRTPRVGGLRYYGHDLETTGLDPKVDAFRCIGIAADADEIFCFDMTPDVKAFVAKLHADPDLLTVGQNSEAFDIPFQEAKGFTFNGPTFDTMIGWHLLNSALPKDLGFIGASVTDEKYWKDDSMYKSGEDALQIGCCKDVHATVRGFEDEYKEMEQLGQTALYFNQIMPLQPVLRHMRQRGVKKDQQRAAGWHIILNRKADEYEIKLKRGLGDASFNVDSPKQLKHLLYDQMGLPVQYVTDRQFGMRPSVDADALDALALIMDQSTDPSMKALSPIFKLVRSIRTLRKWDSTFVCCPQDENYFVHSTFGSAKAATGRLNSMGPNLQNWPNEVREIIVPDTPDHVIISRDWSGIEWRIAMTLAGDETGLDAIIRGRDPHSDAWSKAFQKAYEEVTKRERFEAKAINYGLLYGRSNKSVSEGRAGQPDTYIPLDRVDLYVANLKRELKQYFEFRDSIKSYVLKNHYYPTAWGRRRWWFTNQQLPEAFNFPMQGNAAHMMYIALILLEAQLPKGATLRMSVHDECVVMAHKDVAKQADECMRDIMERRFPEIEQASRYPDIVRHYYPQGWSCASDGAVGLNWRACKPDTDEEKQTEKALRKYLGMAA
jgi:uracil-DNA glycosylase family 4